ncbi:glycosyltransferase family 39 protein, partial [Candidatus Curtissbacteria bacterium]|nr:glycosyltransferase family 39 protein [Candidatus Curtissbacteria bacterium]
YKPPLYTYLVVPSVAVFGLNDFAVRFPSAFLGVLAVLFAYLMVKELLEENSKETTDRLARRSPALPDAGGTRSKLIALLSAFFLAISPWHLQFSRVAFETNSATFWSVLGTWAFLKGVKSQNRQIAYWFSLAAVSFGANLFMYHNARVFIPIYSLALLILFRNFLARNKKYLIIPFTITLLFIALLIPIITSISGQLRYKGTTIFADVSPQFRTSSLIAQDQEAGQELVGRIFHNRRLIYVPILIENYLSHFRPTYLFLTADMERHHAPQIGLLYLWDLPFIAAGIYFLVKNKFPKSTKVIIFWWFLIAPVASSVTWGVPHSLRSEIYLPTYQIFAAVGFITLYGVVRRKKIFLVTSTVVLAFNFLFYLHQYYVHMPHDFSKAWLYGRKQAAEFTEFVKGKYDQVIVSTKLEQPHEFWLYYLKYDPAKYLEEGGTVSGGFLEDRNKFDKYLFKPIEYEKQKQEAKTLFVGLPKEFPPGVNVLKQIKYLNGEPAIYIVGDE